MLLREVGTRASLAIQWIKLDVKATWQSTVSTQYNKAQARHCREKYTRWRNICEKREGRIASLFLLSILLIFIG
jgi:hypothetical protein